MARQYWLFKTEPTTFSIDDLAAAPNQTAAWEGVRNYQARNLLRDSVKVGDGVLFHHSSTKLVGIVGQCTVVRAGYPDHFARDPKSQYFDPKASGENPIWYMVDVKLEEKFDNILSLSILRDVSGLEKMMLLQRGARLSIQPVGPEEWSIITKLARG